MTAATAGTYANPLASTEAACPTCGGSLRGSDHTLLELALARFVCETDDDYRRFLATVEVRCQECGFRGSARG